MNKSMEVLRSEFERDMNRSISMPAAGAIVWLVVALLSPLLEFRMSVLVLMAATGAIFPIGLLIAKVRGEKLVSSDNPFAKLMGLCVLMINLLWALHIPLFYLNPSFVILSVGIGAGLHWIVFSWIVQHPLGLVHSISRALLVLAAWFLFPTCQLLAVGMVIVLVYLFSIAQMLRRPLTLHKNAGVVAST